MRRDRKAVELKGYRDGLHLILDSEISVTQMESAIIKRLAKIGDSLSGKQVVLDISDRDLKEAELQKLEKLLDERYHLKVKKVNGQSQRATPKFTQEKIETPKSTKIIEIGSAPAMYHRQQELLMGDEIHFDSKTDNTRLVRKTLRSGQYERFLEGNIVIVGDVNPGGEVVALGDIVVLGSLRGIAHAGALGDTSAVIIALNLDPTQLRIGQLINRPPSNDRESNNDTPEIARVEDNIIKVSPYNEKLDLLSFLG